MPAAFIYSVVGAASVSFASILRLKSIGKRRTPANTTERLLPRYLSLRVEKTHLYSYRVSEYNVVYGYWMFGMCATNGLASEKIHNALGFFRRAARLRKVVVDCVSA